MPLKRNSNNSNERKLEAKKKYVRYSEGAEIYSVGLHTFQTWAKEAKAIYRIKGVVLVNLQLVEEYLEAFRDYR